MSNTHYCPHCTTLMDELSRHWGEETYYGMMQYIEYGCSHCGEQVEEREDVPYELLPFMPFYDDDCHLYTDRDFEDFQEGMSDGL